MLSVELLAFMAFWIGSCQAIYNNPGSTGMCRSMEPGLPNAPETGPMPFDIILDRDSYSPHQIIRISISARGNIKIYGFHIQARRINEELTEEERATPMGEFKATSTTGLVCTDQQHGSGLMSDQDLYQPVLQQNISWTAPNKHVGHIQFRVTLVTDSKHYWLAERSSILTDPEDTPLPTTPEPKTADPPRTINLDGCGDTKGCYRNPKGCVELACDVVVTWQNRDNEVLFELSADIDGWVAVGFSEDKKMGKDDVTECVWNYTSSQVDVRRSWNEEGGKDNGLLSNPKIGVYNTDSYRTGGRIRCWFTRAKVINGLAKVVDLNSAYHILLAKGDVSPKEPAKKMIHVLEAAKYPYVSPSKVYLQEKVDISGRARYPLVKVHGILMIIGWMMCAGVAVLMTKYYKPMWPNDKLCGQRVWFAVHRGCLLTCMLATIIGFIIIFIHAGGYSQMPHLPAKAHPPLGIVTTILVILNPLIALCRCNPKSRRRPIFNWIHWFIGMVAMVLATPTLFIGLNLPKAHVPWWATWVMVAYMLFHLVIELMLEIHGCINGRKQKMRDDEFELRKKTEGRGEYYLKKPKPVGHHFKCRILVVYLVVTIILGLVMVITVAVS